jgi:hypothetical protein
VAVTGKKNYLAGLKRQTLWRGKLRFNSEERVFCAKNSLPNPVAVSNATDHAKFYSLSHDTVIETRASLARRYPRDFTFYIADPTAPFAFTIWLAT